MLGVEFKIVDENSDKNEHEDTLATKYGRGRSFVENECVRCEGILEATLKRTQREGDRSVYFIASAKVGITVAIPLRSLEDLPEDKRVKYVRGNGISMAYGKIRSMIESITAESLVGKQTLPPIDPYALLENE